MWRNRDCRAGRCTHEGEEQVVPCDSRAECLEGRGRCEALGSREFQNPKVHGQSSDSEQGCHGIIPCW